MAKKSSDNAEIILNSAVKDAFQLSEKVSQLHCKTDKLVEANFIAVERQIKGALRETQRCAAKQQKELQSQFDSIAEQIEERHCKTENSIDAFIAANSSNAKRITSGIDDILSILTSIRDFSSRQSAELLRWKEGYDYRIVKNFITRIIHSIDDIEYKIEIVKADSEKQKLVEELEFVKDVLLSNLDGEGLVRIEPELLKRVEDYGGKVAVDSIIPTDEDEKNGAIAKVLLYGYELYTGEDKSKLIRQAKVAIYKKNQ